MQTVWENCRSVCGDYMGKCEFIFEQIKEFESCRSKRKSEPPIV
jgi:hypothetical protein